MTNSDLEERILDFAQRKLEGADRAAVLSAGEFYVVVKGFPRPVADLPKPGIQVGVDSAGDIEWVSLPRPREAAA